MSNYPLAFVSWSLINFIFISKSYYDDTLINSGSPSAPIAGHPLTEIMNAIMETHIFTHKHTLFDSYPNTACTVEGVFCYFRQRAALCQLPPPSHSLSLSLYLSSSLSLLSYWGTQQIRDMYRGRGCLSLSVQENYYNCLKHKFSLYDIFYRFYWLI